MTKDKYEYREDSSVQETFVDGVPVISVDRYTARIDLSVFRADPPSPDVKVSSGHRVTACRLAMPTPAFLELYNQMHMLMTGLEQNGIVHREGGAIKPTLQ